MVSVWYRRSLQMPNAPVSSKEDFPLSFDLVSFPDFALPPEGPALSGGFIWRGHSAPLVNLIGRRTGVDGPEENDMVTVKIGMVR